MKLKTSKILSDFIDKRIELSKFEEWVYSNSDLEIEIGEATYMELLLVDFRNKSARVNVEKIVDSKIDYGNLHKIEILDLINQICTRNLPFKTSILQLYEWSEMGYFFLGQLDTIGNFNEQGKSIIIAIDDTMSEEEKWGILEMREPNFITELQIIKEKILNNSIVLTGEKEHVQFFGKQFKFEEK